MDRTFFSRTNSRTELIAHFTDKFRIKRFSKRYDFILLLDFVVADSTNELWWFFFAQTRAANAWNAFLGLIFNHLF